MAACGGTSRKSHGEDRRGRGVVSRKEVDRAAGTGRPINVYRFDERRDLSPAVAGDPALVYVPNSMSNTVDVISQRTFKVIARFPTVANGPCQSGACRNA
jgi:YVTN family beta-propeller protein